MFPRDPMRWDTPFGRWVDEFGPSNIVRALGRDPDSSITTSTVYNWLRGQSPRPHRARQLVELSGGSLSLDMIYDHSREISCHSEREPAAGAATHRQP